MMLELDAIQNSLSSLCPDKHYNVDDDNDDDCAHLSHEDHKEMLYITYITYRA